MSASSRVAELVQNNLRTFTDGLRLNSLAAEITPPKPSEWSVFLRENPQFADAPQRIIAETIAMDRTVVEGMNENYQKLAGTLLRVLFSNDQLMGMLKQQ